VEATNAGAAKIVGPTVTAAHGDLVSMSRNVVVTVVVDGKDRETHKVPYGARIRVKDGAEIKKGQRLAEWDPYTTPILTEVGGVVRFEDLMEGVSVREETDEATGIAQRVVSDWRASPRGSDLRPAVGVIQGEGYARLASGSDARYLLPVGAILSVANGDEVKPGEILARIPTEGAKTRDITGGLPRVAELFEARRPKDCAVIAEMDGRVEFGRDYKNKRRIKITPEVNADGVQGEAVEFLIPKGKHISVHDGDLIQKGDYIIDGNPDPHDLLRIQGVEALAEYLVNEVQEVYRLQGVPINDKHIEVIVRQMLQKVEVLDSGETTLIKGDTVEVAEAVLENQKTEKRGGRPAVTQPVLLGITKASLQTRSFISAASFQETTRVLTDASVNGKVDTLEGLKENVIVGRLIPAGTGAYLRSLQKIANERDAELTSQREAAVEPLPADLALELESSES
jgi:DNA-directed RNA polymerase subunit beta'